ncbi:putative nuclease HARBI1 [Cucumis melo var. makuwa]|uniref:Putative nuclease HARBI1 n=1 Tax=Cucumis melo var. makuwa TaxID=1194695 RepID=A0A5D3CA47_CUCMM|nr:putative nuclease HARBI1 [Cucumis melo var. makuwa]
MGYDLNKGEHAAIDHPRYIIGKGEVATKVLEVCNTKGDFVFILADWEGSTADSRIL